MAILKNEAQLYQTTIDGQQYEFAKWGADLSLETLMDLSAVLGKPIGALLAATGGRTDANLNAEALDEVMSALTGALSTNRESVLGSIRKLCAHQVICDHKQVQSFDLHFKGKLGHMFRVARANMEVQYGDFLSELGVSAAAFKKAPPPAAAKNSPTGLSAVPTQA